MLQSLQLPRLLQLPWSPFSQRSKRWVNACIYLSSPSTTGHPHATHFSGNELDRTGAGTFAALLPIYRDLNEMGTGTVAPNALAAVAIEMGRPFLMASLVAAIALIVIFLHGAENSAEEIV